MSCVVGKTSVPGNRGFSFFHPHFFFGPFFEGFFGLMRLVIKGAPLVDTFDRAEIDYAKPIRQEPLQWPKNIPSSKHPN